MAYKRRHAITEKILQTCHTSFGNAYFLVIMIKEYFINLQTKKLLKEALAYGLIFYFMLATCLQCHGFAIQASEMQCSKEIIFSYELKV